MAKELQRYRIANLKIARIWSSIRQVAPGCIWLAIASIASPTVAAPSCPTDIEPLIEQMLPDLPGYANRAIARSRQRGNPDPSSSIIVAGQPEFTPLPLGTARSQTGENGGENGGEKTEENIRQVFLTTLERIYTRDEAIDLQGYHWLFLAPVENGWQLVLMYSTLGSYPAGDVPTPPENTTEGAIAQGVRAWLRDCQAREMERQSRV